MSDVSNILYGTVYPPPCVRNPTSPSQPQHQQHQQHGATLMNMNMNMQNPTLTNAGWAPIFGMGQGNGAIPVNMNQVPVSNLPSSALLRDEFEVARYLRQLADMKIKELDFQKAQVEFLKESLHYGGNNSYLTLTPYPPSPSPYLTSPSLLPSTLTSTLPSSPSSLSPTSPSLSSPPLVHSPSLSQHPLTTSSPPDIKVSDYDFLLTANAHAHLSVPAPSSSSSTSTSIPSSTSQPSAVSVCVPSPVHLSGRPHYSPFLSWNASTASPLSPSLSPSQSPREIGKIPKEYFNSTLCVLAPRKRYLCQVVGCGKALKTRMGLERHSRNHTGGRKFVCDAKGCSKKFLEANTLKRHKRIHSGEKPFTCPNEACRRQFSDGSNYRRHLATHNKEKPFKCPVLGCKVKPCGFTRSATLRTHLFNFHNIKD